MGHRNKLWPYFLKTIACFTFFNKQWNLSTGQTRAAPHQLGSPAHGERWCYITFTIWCTLNSTVWHSSCTNLSKRIGMNFHGPHFFREIANLPCLHDDPLPQPTPCFDSGFTSCLVSLDLDGLKFALQCQWHRCVLQQWTIKKKRPQLIISSLMVTVVLQVQMPTVNTMVVQYQSVIFNHQAPGSWLVRPPDTDEAMDTHGDVINLRRCI